MVKKAHKSLDWGRKVLGLTERKINSLRKQGYTMVYACSVYPHGGGSDRIWSVAAPSMLSPADLTKEIGKIGKPFGDVVEMTLLVCVED